VADENQADIETADVAAASTAPEQSEKDTPAQPSLFDGLEEDDNEN